MNVILPGGTIGILGGGQLGRMMAMEGRRMGYRVGVLDPAINCPAGQVADFHVQTGLVNSQCVSDFVSQVDVVTIETELVPSKLLEDIEPYQATSPSHHVLALVQDRLIQREFLATYGFPQTSFCAISDFTDLRQAQECARFPGILKKRRSGYDGRGQVRVNDTEDLHDAWQALKEVPSVLETLVPFKMELSIVLARGIQGEIRLYTLAENIHQRNILHATRVPAQVDNAVLAQAETLAISLAETLNYCGVMAVEFFLLEDNTLLINEMAPRPHNSGHFTLGACTTSQFEQHLRAICGLPLGDASLIQAVVMVNLLSDLWQNGPPQWEHLLAQPHIKLHLYGKKPSHSGRKMGHFLYFAEPDRNALDQAEIIFRKLSQDTFTGGSRVTEDYDESHSQVFQV